MKLRMPEMPSATLLAALAEYKLLPAIVFMPTRRRCDQAASEAALTRRDPIDRRRGNPSAFVVTRRDLPARTHADAVRSAHACGEDFELRAVLRHLEDTAIVVTQRAPAVAARIHRTTLGEVEVARRISLNVDCSRVMLSLLSDLAVDSACR